MAITPHLGEGLLAPGIIRLFGRKFTGLQIVEEGIDPTSNNPLVLQNQIDRLERARRNVDALQPGDYDPYNDATRNVEVATAAEDETDARDAPDDRKARLARIYGFSYLGSYFKMANPPVLRVFGPGFRVEPGYNPENLMDILGVEFKKEDFVQGIRMWAADQLDVTIRIDITIGWLREILLDTDMSQDTNVTNNSVSRADVVGRDSGLVGRDSGLVGRDSGFVGRPRR
jgi:hypothetical protein